MNLMKILPVSLACFFLMFFGLLLSPVGAQEPAQDVEGVEKVPYSHTNSKGKTYYLFSKVTQLKNSDRSVTLYYFSKDPNNAKGTPLYAVPDDRVVSETSRGMLVLKKKK